MKVICKISNDKDMTFGKVYDVVYEGRGSTYDWYDIVDDNGLSRGFETSLFKTTSLKEIRDNKLKEILG